MDVCADGDTSFVSPRTFYAVHMYFLSQTGSFCRERSSPGACREVVVGGADSASSVFERLDGVFFFFCCCRGAVSLDAQEPRRARNFGRCPRWMIDIVVFSHVFSKSLRVWTRLVFPRQENYGRHLFFSGVTRNVCFRCP